MPFDSIFILGDGKETYQLGGFASVLLLPLPELPLLVFVLDPAAPVVVVAPPADVDVPPLVLLQYPSYQVWRACKSLSDEQLAAPHTLATLLVPWRNGVRRVSVQKQFWLTDV